VGFANTLNDRVKNMPQYPAEITEAIRLHKEHQPGQSREVLSRFLVDQPNTINALLWLAKTTDQPRQAINAAELVFSLDPTSEVAQRAVAAVSQQWPQEAKQSPEFDLLRLTGITEMQSRGVNWPFKGLNRPIGILLDEKKIDLKDLAFAAENAYDPYLKQAARTLLLKYLLQEDLKEQPKPMRFIDGRENLEYHERLASLNSGFLLGVTLTLWLVAVVADISNRFLHYADPNIFTLSYFIYAFLSYFLLRSADRATNEMVQYKIGRRGERMAIDTLRASLRSPWVMVHNLEWPNRKWSDADMIVLGPGGIWSFEVKNYTTLTRNIGDRWQYKSRFGWRELSKHPGKQARRTAMNVKDYLENHNIPVCWVQPVVLWAGEENNLIVEDPAVPVWKLSEVETRLEDLWRQQRLNEEQIRQAAELFEGMIQKVKQNTK
jgi:hypothetical protein